jgi:hypothetical protein
MTPDVARLLSGLLAEVTIPATHPDLVGLAVLIARAREQLAEIEAQPEPATQ